MSRHILRPQVLPFWVPVLLMMLMMMMVVVTVRRGGRRGNHTYTGGTGGAGVLVVIIIVRHVEGAERLLVRGLWVLDETGLSLVGLFLEEAVDFEPVRAASVA